MRWAFVCVALAACGKVSDDACPAGFEDCNGDSADGCEADLSSPATCGTCEQACIAPSGATATCAADTCGFSCGGGMQRCGDACVTRCSSVLDAGEHVYTVPAGCTRMRVKAWGAGGGNGRGNTSAGAGGFALGELAVMPAQTFVVVAGAAGGAAGNTPGAGGIPGGGDGGSASGQAGGGGGGFSGVFGDRVAVELAHVIGGGGGGSGGGGNNNVVAGAGGGTAGQDSVNARGGTQTTGFAQLRGGAGGNQGSGDGGGGGGAGWFGGDGGPGANSDANGGAGGAGFAAPTVMSPLLLAGNRATPGADSDPDRGTAGGPGAAGRVVIDCLP
jgi:hypothetical protein